MKLRRSSGPPSLLLLFCGTRTRTRRGSGGVAGQTATKVKSGIARKKTKDAIQTLVVLERSSLKRLFFSYPQTMYLYVCMYVYMYVRMDLCVSTFFWGVKFGLNPKRKYKKEIFCCHIPNFLKGSQILKIKIKIPYLDFGFSLVRIF